MGKARTEFGVVTHMNNTTQAFLKALCHGVSKIDGITELVDNAIDVSNNVEVIYNKRTRTLYIKNDQKAFPVNPLLSVLKNAEFHSKRGNDTISKYGVGFKKGICSVLNPLYKTQTNLITCDGKTNPYGLTWDIWEDYIEESSVCHEEMAFEDFGLEPFVGTCIIIDNVDLTAFDLEILKDELEVNYAQFLFKGKTLKFNGKFIEPFDPMYAHELGDRINRNGLHDYFINGKVFRVANVEAYHKDDKDIHFPLRVTGLFIPRLTYESPFRSDFINAKENNEVKWSGFYCSYTNRFITKGCNNASQMFNGGKIQGGASRRRTSVAFNKLGADIFRIHPTKNQGIPNICTNELLKDYRVKINGRPWVLYNFILDMWKWTNKMYQRIDCGDIETLDDISEELITKWSVRQKKETILTPADLLRESNIDLDLEAIGKGSNKSISTTELGVLRILNSFKGQSLDEDIIHHIVNAFLND